MTRGDAEPQTPAEAVQLAAELLTSLALDLGEIVGRMSKLAMTITLLADKLDE